MTIEERLQTIFRNVFADDSIVITPETTADDVEGWDSLSHINLIIATEIEFGVEFKQNEVLNLANVGELVNCIEQHLNQIS